LQAVQHVAGDLQLAMPPIIATDWTADSIVHDESMLMVPLARPPITCRPAHTRALISRCFWLVRMHTELEPERGDASRMVRVALAQPQRRVHSCA
jgi:hypothetical protein